MKLEFTENDYGADITLLPETVDEFAKLARLAKNASSQKPSVYLSFRNTPHCYIRIHKRKPSVQINSIEP